MMNKELINEPRLTPTMERTRNGSTQLFREKREGDQSFISSTNADVTLVHERKEMYAELIDGQWYWVTGCAECKGEPRDWMTYVECEEHDRCSVCSTNRKDIVGIPWGGKRGWTCKSCKEAEDLEVRREAFAKLKKDPGIDHTWTDSPVCPHCGTKQSRDEIENGDTLECHVCEGQFEVELEYSVTFSTTIKGKRIKK